MSINFYLLLLSTAFIAVCAGASLAALVFNNSAYGKIGFRAYLVSSLLFQCSFIFLTNQLLHEIHIGTAGSISLPLQDALFHRITYLWGQPAWMVSGLILIMYTVGLIVYAVHRNYVRQFREEFFFILSLVLSMFIIMVFPLKDIAGRIIPAIPVTDSIHVVRDSVVVGYGFLVFAGCAVLIAVFCFMSALLCSQCVEKTYSTAAVMKMLFISWIFLTCALSVRLWWFLMFSKETTYWCWYWTDNLVLATWVLLLCTLEYLSIIVRTWKWSLGFPLLIIALFALSSTTVNILLSAGLHPLPGGVSPQTVTRFFPLIAILGSGIIIVAEMRGRLFSRLASTHILSQDALLLIRNSVMNLLVVAIVAGGVVVAVTGKKISDQFFVSALYPLTVIWLGVTCIYVRTSWASQQGRLLNSFFLSLVPALALTGVIVVVIRIPVAEAIVFFFAILLLVRIAGIFSAAAYRLRRNGYSLARALFILLFRYPSTYSWNVIYAGIVITVFGITLSVMHAERIVVSLKQGETVTVQGEQFTLANVYQTRDDRRHSITAEIAVRSSSDVVKLHTRKIIHAVPYRIISVPVIHRNGYVDYRIDLEGWENLRTMTFTFLTRPFSMLIWAGGMVLITGALLTCCNQRSLIEEQ